MSVSPEMFDTVADPGKVYQAETNRLCDQWGITHVPWVRNNRLRTSVARWCHDQSSGRTWFDYGRLSDDHERLALIDTARHEFAHHLAWMVYGIEGVGHGAKWQEACDVVQAYPRATFADQWEKVQFQLSRMELE